MAFTLRTQRVPRPGTSPRAGTTGRRLAATSTACAAAMALVSACGGGGGHGDTDKGGGSKPPAEVTIGTAQQVTTLDPDLSVSQEQLEVINLFAGTLTQFNADASEVGPGLASSWDVSDDEKTYTFHLRPDLEFSDGSPLTAADAAATFNREMTDESNVNAGLVAGWESVTAPDDSTVVFALNVPQPAILTLLADPSVGPVLPAAAADDPESFFANPVSAGAYKVESYSAADSDVVLVRNDKYWGEKPSIPKVHFVFVNDVNTRIVQLKEGTLDVALTLPSNTLSQLSGDTEGVIAPAYGGLYLYVNDRSAPLDDVNVRKAISMAIDRDQLSKVGFEGAAPPLYGFWSSKFTWAEDVLPTGVDVDGAKELLKGTACESGCKLTLKLRTSQSDDLASLVAQDLAAIGIDASIQRTDPATLTDDEANGNFDLAINGLYDYANRPDVMLTYGLLSDGGIEALYSGYKSDEMDDLIQQAMTTSGDAGVALNKQINEVFAEDLPYVPLVDFVYVNGQTKNTEKWITLEPSSFFYVTPDPSS